ncbi:EamA family transporter [Halarcobacter ebronensis]|uniref:EamA family transporter n=1 Tax=Halarcobacter ebronensis TaxID=1462615 RepID=A0A4Q0YDD6_9BACT|nr:DMT family transporter [Halarcobacter ebronensis]RXJ68470.1 EamA family transporter [Halarcobacter ebronensis]
MKEKSYNIKLFLLIVITLFFFSTSSLLARAALINNHIDAFSFTFFRLFFGALTLLLIFFIKEKKYPINIKINWLSAFCLFLYAITFSYAYINLDAGIGTLILFAIVQLVIMKIAFLRGEKISKRKSFGIFLAFMGLFYLLFPSEELNLPFYYVLLMIISGFAWAFYTILGKKSINALYNTTDNFVKALLFATIFYLLFIDSIYFNSYGVLLSFISGGITSSLGYLLWYHILPQIDISTSGIIQLIVPPLAIVLGIFLLDETFTFKLFFSADIILIGIAIAILNSKNVKRSL